MKKSILILLLFSTILSVSAQKVGLRYYIPGDQRYNSNIPTPREVIGHGVGEWHVSHDNLLTYMRALAKASDRISLEETGKTYEGRPLVLLTITSPENHERLEEIRQKHIKATEDFSIDRSNDPIVVYQGFSIHGNEPSGSNAALAAAYFLAASTTSATKDLLRETIILFDPSLNPDGLQRFAYWANTNKSKNLNPDPNDREFREIWPRGRTNHYWFDMNRDWLAVQLPESQARIKAFHKWLPNILTDHHEMGSNSTFFFQPGIPSRTHPMTPQLNQELTREIGNYHAKALDQIGSQYYSEESFDDFYYGKGSTFPDINGGIGILFEQGSSRGHAQETANGILTFPFTIRNQYIAAMSTLKAANEMRVKILNYQQDFYRKVGLEAEKYGSTKRRTKTTHVEDFGEAIVFGDEKDAAKTYHLAEVLHRHGVKIHELKGEGFITAKDKKVFKPGYAYLVPMNQKKHRLVKAMFDVRTSFKDSLFYDVSAWTFNHSFGLDFVKNVSLKRAGKEIRVLKPKKGAVSSQSAYGYLMPWNEYYAPKVLNAILQKGLRAKVAMKNFKNGDRSYEYGTIFIPVQNQKLEADELFKFLKNQVEPTGVQIYGVTTGLNEGIDLGSRNFSNVKRPKVGMLVGGSVSGNDAGEIWHLFDQRFDMHITKLDVSYLSRIDLHKYTTLIVPSSGNFDKAIENKLKSWVQNGGVLIGYRNAIRWMQRAKLINVQFERAKVDSVKNVSFENRSLQSGAQVIGGAIFEADIDRSHPINFGYKNKNIALFRNTTLFLTPDKRSYNNPIQYTNNPLLSGYISEENAEVIKNTVPFKVQRMGRGRVLIFTDNTNFRAFWHGTNKLLMNAVFFGDKM